jgi:two-component system LytT family sensor kinase
MAAGLESGAEPEAISQSRWIRLALIWGAWTLIGLMFASQLYFALINTQKPISFSRALFSQFVPCYALALVTPGLLMFARRFPIERQNWRRSVVLHAVASITLGIALLTIQYVIEVAYLRGAQQMSRPDLLRFLIYNVDTQVGIYWLIILLSHAFRYYNRYRKGEVKSSQLEAMLVRSQLQALKMQLHPHFLFNTLHSISALLNRDTNAARSMIAALGDFLRLTLENQGAE